MDNFLFELINSLSTSEKVYFKRSSKTHAGKKGKNYLKLYDFVEKQKEYKKDSLSKAFKGTKIEKYLSSEVDYLKEKLLISLFNYNLNRSKRNQIQKGILIIEVLTNKGFRKEALKKLKFIKLSAFKQEEYTWVLRLIELEEIILFKEGVIGYKDKLKQLREQRIIVTNTIQNLNNYHIIREEIREFQFSEHLDISVITAFKEMCKNPLVLNEKECLSIKAKEHWYYIQVLVSYLKRDFKSGLIVSEKYVQFMLLNLHLFEFNKILPGLSNYIFHAALTSNEKHFNLGQEMLLKLSQNNNLPPSYIHYILYTRNLELAYFSSNNELMQRYLELATGMLEDELPNLEESQIQYLYMLIVRSTIVLQQNKIGIYYINQWIQHGVLPYRMVQARLFSIIIHLELNYLELLRSELIVLKKLIKNNPREKILIQTFYTFLNKYLKNPNKDEMLIVNFQNDLKNISINVEGLFDLISFDYYKWSLRL